MGGGGQARRAPRQPGPIGEAAPLLFGDYLLAGELLLPRGIRLSDFLSQAKPFQTLLEAGLYPLVPDRPIVELEPVERFPFVTVNLRLAEGVAEAPGEGQDPRLTLFG